MCSHSKQPLKKVAFENRHRFWGGDLWQNGASRATPAHTNKWHTMTEGKKRKVSMCSRHARDELSDIYVQLQLVRPQWGLKSSMGIFVVRWSIGLPKYPAAWKAAKLVKMQNTFICDQEWGKNLVILNFWKGDGAGDMRACTSTIS